MDLFARHGPKSSDCELPDDERCNSMITQQRVLRVTLVVLMSVFSLPSFAEETTQSRPLVAYTNGAATAPVSSNFRKQMADCLKTGKSDSACQQQIAKDCPNLAKTGQCPLQEAMGPRQGARHHIRAKNAAQTRAGAGT